MKRNPWLKACTCALLVAATVVACREVELPTQPDPPGPPEPPPADTARVVTRFTPVVCTVKVAERKTDCGDTKVAANDLIIGGQGRYIHIGISNESYNVNSQQYSLTMAVRNLIGQRIGTSNGFSLDPTAVRVFFENGPIMTAGTGNVSLLTTDGYGNFTAGMQPYIQFNNVLEPFQLSSTRQVQFSMPSSVTNFTFTVYVATVVQYPNGWIEVTPTPFPIAPKASWQMTATHKNVVGDPIPGSAVTWSIADSMVAQLASDGTVTGVRAGSTVVTATAGPRSGSATLNVHGIIRTWSAGAGTTDWHTGNNWTDGVVPVSVDSVVVPTGMPLYPVLSASVAIAMLTVQASATVNISAFDLTISQNVATDLFSGGVNGTSGRVILTGTARTIQGRFDLARLRVLGTYSLTGNVTSRAPLEIVAGRITNSAFRVMAISQ